MDSKCSAVFLRRSWWIVKQVAIAGAAITSAPVIIPPLFVLSTLGLAFSFPFGIYLAGYVCTDKIMSLLLPLPLLRERGFDADKGDEMVLAAESGVESGVKEASTCERVGEEDEMSKCDFANSANEVRQVQLVEEAGEDGTAAPDSSGSRKSPYTAVVLGAYKESNKKEYEPPNLCSEHLSIVELKAEGKGDDNLAIKGLREEGGEEEERLRIANGCVVAEDKELPEECRTEVPRLISDYFGFN